jgi:hypothetical protein
MMNDEPRVQEAAEAYALDPTPENWVALERAVNLTQREKVCGSV